MGYIIDTGSDQVELYLFVSIGNIKIFKNLKSNGVLSTTSYQKGLAVCAGPLILSKLNLFCCALHFGQTGEI